MKRSWAATALGALFGTALAETPEHRAASAINRFAAALQAKLPEPEGNLVYSPFSISAAMSILSAGARGATEEQIRSALHLPGETGHEDMSALLLWLGSGTSEKLAIANAIWPQKAAPVRPEFLELTHGKYRAEARELDFKTAPEPARQTINGWVSEHTMAKIPEVLGRGIITARTRMVVTNAIYFKGAWTSEFKKTKTYDEQFTVKPGQTIPVAMMHQSNRYGYSETGALQALELGYAGGRLGMVILLPKRTDGLAQLEAGLTPENLEAWTRPGPGRTVDVSLPRFKLESGFSLNESLEKLGIKDAFASSADFSGINGARDLYLSAVVHKAVIEVNEEGTEAAAATGGVLSITSAMPSQPTIFKADHPFLYVIRDRKTGCILFAGRVVNPQG